MCFAYHPRIQCTVEVLVLGEIGRQVDRFGKVEIGSLLFNAFIFSVAQETKSKDLQGTL